MIVYIIEISKYLMLLFLILYLIPCVVYEIRGENKKKTGIFVIQELCLFIIQFLAYLSLCLRTGNLDYLFFYAFLQIVLFATIVLFRMIYPKIDRCLLNNMALLLSVGFIILTRLDFSKAVKQFGIVIVSLLISFAVPYVIVNFPFLKKWKWIYTALGIVALLAVLVLGQVTHGSKISYSIAGITLQPSEFVKILFVFCVAAFLYESTSLLQVFFVSVVAAIHVLILVVSKDLGSAAIFFVGYAFMLLVATRNYLYLLLLMVIGGSGSILAYKMFSHVRVRVAAFRDPFSVIEKEGYQISQSLFALGSGSWFGKGLNKGVPGDIPYVESDFIFSAVSEEMGVLFAIGVLLVCISCFLIFMRNAKYVQNQFYHLVSVGLGVMYIFQVFLTVGGGIKFIPLTGVTLPFVSYGGSSVLTSVLIFSILQGITQLKMKNEEETVRVLESNVTIGAFSALYFAMIVFLCVYVAGNEQTLLNNSYNSRQALLNTENTRGKIFDRTGEVLAETVTQNGREMRSYPYQNLFSHVVGFSQRGKTGIEAMGNYYLINSNIPLSQKIENDVSGKKNPGNNVYTTLDLNLQQIAEKSLGMYRGAVVVSDVKTGDILACVSHPDFDPNTIVEDWDDYVADTESSVLLNRATQGIYPPGSTFKIVTALEYIKEHNGKTDDYSFSCHGRFTYETTTIQCYNGSNHGTVDFTTSFAKSCNSSFANMGVQLDKNEYGKTLDKLLFNQNLPLDINYSKSNLKVDDNVSSDDMIQISIGQGKAQITPIHLNMITNAIANQGSVMKPKLIDHIESADGDVIKEYGNEKYATLMSTDEANQLKDMCVEVVNRGTATKLKNDSYQAAGKTGSAEYNGVKEDSHAWFTGFAPADDPQVSVTIIIEGIGSGGDYAVPIAKRIFDGYFGL